MTLTIAVPLDDADWLDCPLDDELFVVLLSLLTHPEAKTTKTKIPIIPNIPILKFFKNKPP
jgi:hypothetical protein